MKIRIKGNSLRFRLTRSEVDYFSKFSYLEESTEFGGSTFIYALQSSGDGNALTAGFTQNKMMLNVPASMAKEWTGTERVGLESEMEIGQGKKLYLLVEKDFKCLDNTIEDQSDNYENPLAQKNEN